MNWVKRQLGVFRDWIEYRACLLVGLDLKKMELEIQAEAEEIERNHEMYAAILKDPNNNITI